MFKSGIVPDDFLQTIAAFVHPIVAHEISQCLARVANKFRTISTYTRKLVQENKTINWGPALNIDNDVISFMVHLQYKKILWQYYTSKLLRACSPNKAKRKYYAEKAQRIKHLIQRKRQLDKYFKNIFS